LKIKFYEVSENLVGKFDDANYDEKLVKTLDMDFIPQNGATICGDDGIWQIADVCYNYDEEDKVSSIDVTVILK
jgi:hypothetical protein